MNEMMKLTDCLSPISWLLIHLAGWSTFLVLLHPNFRELLMFLTAEIFSLVVSLALESWSFMKLFPDTRLYFKEVDEEKIAALDTNGKHRLLESMFSFPTRRATWCFLTSFVKVIPAVTVTVFFWRHAERSNYAQASIFLGLILVNFSYFYGGVFIESHRFLSKLIARLHAQYDWSEAFLTMPIRYSRRDFVIQERISMIALMSSCILLVCVVILAHGTVAGPMLAVKVLLIACTAASYFLRISFLSRTFFIDGLENLFTMMDRPNSRNAVLPFHSYPLLARFENTFNLLVNRVRKSEQELSSVVFHEAEKSRYRALGEMSGLVAHDLSGPLHVVRFCVDQLQEDTQRLGDKRYLDYLSTNVDRSIELIDSLRARLKDGPEKGTKSSLIEAHTYVMRLLRTQFGNDSLNSIQIQFDPRLELTELQIPRTDLIHILDNLYRNAIQNMLKNSVSNPVLRIEKNKTDHSAVEITISDNGTGLSPERFEQLTAYGFSVSPDSDSRATHGLGLRLTRRLTELHQGSLSIRSESSTPGTSICLRLRETSPPRGLVTEAVSKEEISEVG